MVRGWKSFLVRYGLALLILGVILGTQALLLSYSIKINFTIPVIVGLVAASWYGGRRPGLFLAVMLAGVVIFSNPIGPDVTLTNWAITLASTVALLIFVVILISERQVAEVSLREFGDRYRLLFDKNPLSMWVYDLETLRFVAVNHSACHFYGYSREEFLEKTIKDIRPPEDVPGVLNSVANTVDDIAGPSIWKHRKKDGTLIDAEITSYGILFDGRQARLVLSNDVTERRKAEAAILRMNEELELRVADRTAELQTVNGELQSEIAARKEAESELDQFFTLSLDMLGIARTDGYFKRVNPAFTETLGWSTEEMLARPFLDLVHPDDQAETVSVVGALADRKQVVGFENRYLCKDGTWRILSWKSVPQAGGIIYASARDVTQLRETENALKQTNAELTLREIQLVESNKELESFSYTVSHDLRAPLRHINGFSLALLEDYSDKLDDVGKQFLNEVRSASREMARLIDDLLELARVTRSEINNEPIDLSELARSVTDLLMREHAGRKVRLVIDESLSAYGDKGLLQILLINLLGNAWKFTAQRDEANIRFGREQKNGDEVYFVRDNGAGFDMTYVDKLFGAFQRLHTADEFDGMGIGLATVQRIVKRHGGRVWAEGAVDRGASIYFTLPKEGADL